MSQFSVYVGHWVDWSKGPILGNQVTVSASVSNFLIAFIAVFITIVGGVTWSTVAYSLHQLRATRRETDGLHHLHQALLRNVSSPLVFIIRIVMTGFTWRKISSTKPLMRALSLITVAFLVYVVFVAAGVLLSLLATTGSVLLTTPHCMVHNGSLSNFLTTTQLADFVLKFDIWENQEAAMAFAYAQQCYPATASQMDSGAADVNSRATVSNCRFYPKPWLNWTTTYLNVCPFGDGVCLGSDIIQFDTGYVDTNDDLGINDPLQDRLQFRKKTTCAPLDTERFSTGYENTSLGRIATYRYGKNHKLPGPWPKLMTDQFSQDVSFVSRYTSPGTSFQPYNIQVATTFSVELDSNGSIIESFSPVPEIMGNNSDKQFTLLFLENRALYTEPVDDIWFNATTELDEGVFEVVNKTVYYSSQPGAVLGCVDSAELCNPALPANNRCINAVKTLNVNAFDASITTMLKVAAPLKLNPHQESLTGLIAGTLSICTMARVVQYLGPNALAAKDYLINGETDTISSALSPQQWQVELHRFQAITLAAIQRSVFIVAAGPSNEDLLNYFTKMPTALEWVCKSQKFYNSDYFSYSVLGLALLFGSGGLIILLSIVLNFLVPAIQLRTGRGIHRRDQWFTNDALFLLASLYNAKGYGVWTTDPIHKTPTTMPDDKFTTYSKSVVRGNAVTDSPTTTSHVLNTKHSHDGSEPLLDVPGGPGISLSTFDSSYFASIMSYEPRTSPDQPQSMRSYADSTRS